MSKSDGDKEYSVGYGRPPRNTQFKKGQSGNPKGRPSGSKNLSTLLDQALSAEVLATENGKRLKVTKREAMITQLVNKGASGDPRAIKLLLDEMRLIEIRMEASSPDSSSFDEGDREVMRLLRERVQRLVQHPETGEEVRGHETREHRGEADQADDGSEDDGSDGGAL